MKELTLAVLVAVLVSVSGFLIKVPTSPISPSRTALGSRGWVHMQKLILLLFDNVCEVSTDPVIVRLSQEFTFDGGDYTDPNVITNLKNLKTGGNLLPKGEIFSEYDTNHWNELQAIYTVLYNAKDFDTFFKTASWARQNMNCGLFVDAIYLAILNRRDISKLSMPAPYELLPNYFIRKDIIIKASSLLAGEDFTVTDNVRDEGNAYILDAAYTENVNDVDDEKYKLAYFREDIGLNSYYFLRKLKLAPWLNTPADINNKYGEYMYLMMKQFTARYDLERYANGLPELESIKWDSPLESYDPMLIYSNGNEFIHRMYDSDLADSNEIDAIQSIENNIGTVVTHMRQTGYNKTQIINHLMEIFVTSSRSYENLGRKVLSGVGATNGHVSVLDHLLTSQRDPVFWRLNKRIVEIIDNALKVMPKYSRNELYFPGVEVINVETKKLMTQFDTFQFDVTDSLKSSDSDTSFQVKISQSRLGHKPFFLKLNISSLITGQKGLVKIYLGPKMLPGELAAKKNQFVLLDLFEISLKRGINIISRSSDDMKSFSNDFLSLPSLRQQVENAEFGFDSLPLNTIDSQLGYPSRLILPKGTTDGLPLELFVFVAPFTKASLTGSLSLLNSEFNTAVLSPGYPLDLLIEDHELFNLPNAFVKDIIITHKGENKNYEGGGKKWTGGKSYDPSSRPDYTAKRGGYKKGEEEVDYEEVELLPDINHGLLGLRPDFTKRKEPVDNSAKRGQYGNKSDYASRKVSVDESRTNIITDDLKNLSPETTYKIREPYDYEIRKEKRLTDINKKKDKYTTKDYTKKYAKYLTDKSNEDENFITNIDVDDLAKVDLEKELIENDSNLMDKYKFLSNEVDDTMDIINKYPEYRNDIYTMEPVKSIEEPPKKRWTIFDYFVPPTSDNSEEKVYE